MTHLEELVWAAAYVAALPHKKATRVDQHTHAVGEADAVVEAMRRACGYTDGRLHADTELEKERVEQHRDQRNPFPDYYVRMSSADRGGGMPMDRVEVTFPQGQNTVTIKEAKRAARETLTKMEEERKPVSAEAFEQKATRVEQAVAELKEYRETLDKKLAGVMSLAEELRKEREEQ